MKSKRAYVCQECGHQEPKWLGRCPACGAWSTLVEETLAPAGAAPAPREAHATLLAEVASAREARRSTNIAELDRVLGGGLVVGALVLVGGDPGIGKSTLLLQALGRIAASGRRCLYVTAEESLAQVKLRAERLGLSAGELYLLAETAWETIDAARRECRPEVMVVDSVQTVGLGTLESAVGSVAQIRGVTAQLMALAKGEGTAVFVVGHVTKEGTIAGPKVMEHMVDTVLYFEGERSGPYRLLRAHKNRFGSVAELGVFEMRGDGLHGVDNPSELFLSQRADGPGSVVVTSVAGSRPLLLEVQALTAPCLYGSPRRISVGFDPQRVAVLCAVLDRRASVDVGNLDVYVNIAGGVRVSEPATDLGVALALASTLVGRPIAADTVVVGEIGLAGEVRAVAQLGARIQEAETLGFARCLVPQIDLERWPGPRPALPLVGVADLRQALAVTRLVS